MSEASERLRRLEVDHEPDAWPAVAAELTMLREAHGELSSLRQRVAELGIELALHGDEVPHDFIADKLTAMLKAATKDRLLV